MSALIPDSRVACFTRDQRLVAGDCESWSASAGKRYVVKITAMQKVQSIVDMVLAQLSQGPPISACSLLVNGKPADLDLPFRLANIGPQAKIELKTGDSSALLPAFQAY